MTDERQDDALVLRRATIDDAPAIRALTREAYAKWVPLINREPLPMLADYAEAAQQHRIDLLYLAGELAALIEMIPQAGHLLIENVAVAQALHRKTQASAANCSRTPKAWRRRSATAKSGSTPTSASSEMCSSTASSAIGSTGRKSSKGARGCT